MGLFKIKKKKGNKKSKLTSDSSKITRPKTNKNISGKTSKKMSKKEMKKLKEYSTKDSKKDSKEYSWKGKDLPEMSKPEKKNFLDMDMTERMIRTEQKVAASFGEKIPYKETEYYCSLSDDEKKRFKKHLKKRGKRGPMLVLSVLASGALLTVLGNFLNNPGTMELTGNVVQKSVENTCLGMNEIGFVGVMFLVAIFTGIFVFVSSLVFNRKKRKRFDGHIAVIDRVLSKKYK